MRNLALITSTAMVIIAMAATPAVAAPADGEIRPAGSATVVPDSYIVVLKHGTPSTLAAHYGGTLGHTYRHALKGFEISMPDRAAKRLAADASVAYVQRNGIFSLTGTQSPVPSWGLDRIDQRNLPLNNSYTYPVTANGVRAYIIDTGIRFTHSDFGGRAVTGFDAIDGGPADDCHGHGTHVAGTTGGASYGVAKGVTLVGVRVLDCAGSGSYAQVIAGIDWVTGDHDPGELAVANMSLGGGFDQATNDAVTASIADGVSYAIAAGNSSADACGFTPASTPNAITVGATEYNDARASYSNFGTCLDIFAPGSGITSAWYTSDTATNTISGTSMASPHVAGAAALVLAQNPSFTPQQVRDSLVNNATNGVVGNPGTGSPNKLLFVVNAADNDFTVGNGASFETGTQATGSFMTIFTNQPVTDENRAFGHPWPEATPGGVFVQSSLCATRPRILYVGPSGSGTQINLYYPNDYAGGTNTEPFGMCGSLGNATFTLQPKAGFGSAMTKSVPLAASKPGMFLDFSAANTPAGVHLNAVTGTQTSIASCNATPALCPVSTGGQMNYLIVFTTGAEKYGCPTPTTSCTPPLSGLSFTLGPVGGPDVAQQLTFFGWAGFLGQEQANVRLAAGTPAGEKRLKVTGSSQALIVRLGAAN